MTVELVKIGTTHHLWVDERGNIWEPLLYTKTEADAASASLKNCRGCSNCKDCEHCIECIRCKDCRSSSKCIDCVRCKACHMCVACSCCLNCIACSDSHRCEICTKCVDCHNCCSALKTSHLKNAKLHSTFKVMTITVGDDTFFADAASGEIGAPLCISAATARLRSLLVPLARAVFGSQWLHKTATWVDLNEEKQKPKYGVETKSEE